MPENTPADVNMGDTHTSSETAGASEDQAHGARPGARLEYALNITIPPRPPPAPRPVFREEDYSYHRGYDSDASDDEDWARGFAEPIEDWGFGRPRTTLSVGQKWPDWKDAAFIVAKESYEQCLAACRVTRSVKQLKTIACHQRKEQGCQYVYAKWDQYERAWVISKYTGTHTCKNTEVPKRLGIRRATYVVPMVSDA